MDYDQQSPEHQQQSLTFPQMTPEKKIILSQNTTPNSKRGAFVKVHIDETPKTYNFNYLETPKQTPSRLFQDQGLLSFKPVNQVEIKDQFPKNQQIQTQILRSQILLNFSQDVTVQKDQPVSQQAVKIENLLNIEEQQNSSSQYLAIKSSNIIQKGKRSQDKGLKVLSQMVLEIVNRLGLSTYKQVTDTLVQQLIQKDLSSKSTKEQTNIKRRAYDILNVLVSSGQLIKRGKQIGPNHKISTLRSDLFKLKKQIDQKRKVLKRKEKNLVSLQTEYLEYIKLNGESQKLVIPEQVSQFIKQIISPNSLL